MSKTSPMTTAEHTAENQAVVEKARERLLQSKDDWALPRLIDRASQQWEAARLHFEQADEEGEDEILLPWGLLFEQVVEDFIGK